MALLAIDDRWRAVPASPAGVATKPRRAPAGNTAEPRRAALARAAAALAGARVLWALPPRRVGKSARARGAPQSVTALHGAEAARCWGGVGLAAACHGCVAFVRWAPRMADDVRREQRLPFPPRRMLVATLSQGATDTVTARRLKTGQVVRRAPGRRVTVAMAVAVTTVAVGATPRPRPGRRLTSDRRGWRAGTAAA